MLFLPVLLSFLPAARCRFLVLPVYAYAAIAISISNIALLPPSANQSTESS